MPNEQQTTIEELVYGSLEGLEQGWLHFVIFRYHDCGGEIRVTLERKEDEDEQD